jgi:hypothetical protein
MGFQRKLARKMQRQAALQMLKDQQPVILSPESEASLQVAIMKSQIEERERQAYIQGVNEGVHKIAEFAVLCLQDALKKTKGVGAKLYDAVLMNYKAEFESVEKMDECIAKDRLVQMNTLYIADQEMQATINEANSFNRSQFSSNHQLTASRLLSIINTVVNNTGTISAVEFGLIADLYHEVKKNMEGNNVVTSPEGGDSSEAGTAEIDI